MFDPRDFTSDPRPPPEARPKERRSDEQITTDAWRADEARRTYYKSSEYHAEQRARFVERRAARRNHSKEREDRERNGHRREYDPRRTKRQTFQDRTDRAIADVGMYRNVAYRDVADAHFEGHPYAARRAVDQMVRAGHVREHNAEGPQGGSYKVLTLTERGVERA